MKKTILWINYTLVLVMLILVALFIVENKGINQEQQEMITKKQEQYNVKELTEEHYDEEWKELDKKQEEKAKSVHSKMKWIMTLVWINLMAIFLYFFIHLKETNLKTITRIVLILAATILVVLVDSAIASVVLMALALLFRKKYKQFFNITLFGLGLFSPFLIMYVQ